MDKRIQELLGLIERDTELITSIGECERLDKHLNITGLCEQEKGYIVAAIADKAAKKPVVITSDAARARLLAGYVKPFVNGEVVILTPREMSLVNALASSRDPEIERLGALCKIINNDYGAAIICGGGLLNRMPPKKAFMSFAKTIKFGEALDPSEFSMFLIEAGYERVGMVTLWIFFHQTTICLYVFHSLMTK